MIDEEIINTRVELIDNYTQKMQSIIQITERFSQSLETMASSIDAVTNSLNNLNSAAESTFSRISNSSRSSNSDINNNSDNVKTLRDRFSELIEKIRKPIQMAISIKDTASRGIERIRSSLVSFKQNATQRVRLIINNIIGQERVERLRQLLNRLKEYRIIKIAISLKDGVSNAVERIKNRMRSIRSVMTIANIKDNVSQGVTRIKTRLSGTFIGRAWQAILTAKDVISPVANRAFNKLKGATKKVWNITIKAKDLATKVLGGLSGKLSKLSQGITIGLKAGVQGLGQNQVRNVTMGRIIENSGVEKAKSKKKATLYDSDMQKLGSLTQLSRDDMGLLSTRSLMLSKGDTGKAKQLTENMATVQAFGGSQRTSVEIAEAFTSAKSGDLSSLNNILGEDYSSFEEAMKGIEEKQGGLLKDYSETIQGKFATLKHNMLSGMIAAVEPFKGVIVNAMDGIMSIMSSVGPKFIEFSGKIATVINGGELIEGNPMINQLATIIGSIPEAVSNMMTMLTENIDFEAILEVFQPVFDLITWFLDDVNNKSGVASGLMSILGTVITTAFEMMGPVIEAVAPIIQSILSFIAEHSQSINNIISALGVIWSAVWSLIGPILQTAWAIISPILGLIVDLIGMAAGKLVSFSNKWSELKEKLSKNPIVGTVKTIFTKVGDFIGGVFNPKKNHAFGLNYVPYNDYVTRLHEGEMVLTKQEANKYRSKNGANMNIGKLADTIVIREDADIDKITSKLVQKLNENRIAYGGAF